MKVYCGELFRRINILPLIRKLLLSLLSLIVDNTEDFKRNSDTHNINTKHKYANLIIYQKGVYCTGIKYSVIFDLTLKCKHGIKLLLPALKESVIFLLFCSLKQIT